MQKVNPKLESRVSYSLVLPPFFPSLHASWSIEHKVNKWKGGMEHLFSMKKQAELIKIVHLWPLVIQWPWQTQGSSFCLHEREVLMHRQNGPNWLVTGKRITERALKRFCPVLLWLGQGRPQWCAPDYPGWLVIMPIFLPRFTWLKFPFPESSVIYTEGIWHTDGDTVRVDQCELSWNHYINFSTYLYIFNC